MTTKTDKQQKITEVLTQMREGKSLRQASQMAGVARQTFLDWVDKDQELAGQYAHARAAMIDKIADDIMTIADEELVATGEGRVDSAMVQKQRLRVDTRKWLLSKLSPKKYGDKLELSGDEQAPVSIQRIERVIVKK
jgi:transposase